MSSSVNSVAQFNQLIYHEAMQKPALPSLSQLESYDPYDLWSTNVGVKVRESFYRGDLLGKLGAVTVASIDWLFPETSRQLTGASKRIYPISLAHWILAKADISEDEGAEYLKLLIDTSAVHTSDSVAWGLGFPWMSKNGLYDERTPFITHTPYSMEALLHLAKHCPGIAEQAHELFLKTRTFLDSLEIMAESDTTLALSYAPIYEPRIVVNANSYAAFAYALHHEVGLAAGTDVSDINLRLRKLVHWVLSQQQADGSWLYYADDQPGNFIDCFHTCFVLKNLIKVAQHFVDADKEAIQKAVDLGHTYLRNHFVNDTGLMNRFTVRDIKDPYVFDLYDQAEYLGVLIDRGLCAEARAFSENVIKRFAKHNILYSKIDLFGRLWGKDFYRWGILPFLYQLNRLESEC